jgi:hypothetical protein
MIAHDRGMPMVQDSSNPRSSVHLEIEVSLPSFGTCEYFTGEAFQETWFKDQFGL